MRHTHDPLYDCKVKGTHAHSPTVLLSLGNGSFFLKDVIEDCSVSGEREGGGRERGGEGGEREERGRVREGKREREGGRGEGNRNIIM